MQTLAADEADAADYWHIPLDDWYRKPRWARAGMVAHIRKINKARRWREIWDRPKKGNK